MTDVGALVSGGLVGRFRVSRPLFRTYRFVTVLECVSLES